MRKLNEVTAVVSLIGLIIATNNAFIGFPVAALGILGSYIYNYKGEFDSKLRDKIFAMKQHYNSGVSFDGKNEGHLYWIQVNCSENEIKSAIKLGLIPDDWSATKYGNDSSEEIKKLNWSKFN